MISIGYETENKRSIITCCLLEHLVLFQFALKPWFPLSCSSSVSPTLLHTQVPRWYTKMVELVFQGWRGPWKTWNPIPCSLYRCPLWPWLGLRPRPLEASRCRMRAAVILNRVDLGWDSPRYGRIASVFKEHTSVCIRVCAQARVCTVFIISRQMTAVFLKSEVSNLIWKWMSALFRVSALLGDECITLRWCWQAWEELGRLCWYKETPGQPFWEAVW